MKSHLKSPWLWENAFCRSNHPFRERPLPLAFLDFGSSRTTFVCFVFFFSDDSLIIKMCWIILSQRGYLSELPRQSLSWKRYAFHIFGVFRANILLHYFARYFRWSLRITFALCWRIFTDSCSLSSLPSVMCGCAGKYISLGKYLFHWVFFSVWWCKLAAAGRGGSRFQGCLGYLLALFFASGLPR